MRYTSNVDERLLWATRRGTTSALLTLRFGLERGLTTAEALAGSQLTQAVLEDPDAEIEGWQELALLRNLAQRMPVSAGLELGARYTLTSHGIYGFLLLGCRTVRRAIELGLRYLELTCAFIVFTLEEERGQACIVLDDVELPRDLQAFVSARDSAILMRVRQQILGPAPASREIGIRHPAPPDAERFAAHYGVPVTFGAPRTQSCFPAAFLDLPLPQANEHTVAQCDAHCRALLQRRHAARGLIARVRDKLLEKPGCFPSLEEVARALAQSPRTLRRGLSNEGTSFRALVDALRLSLAEELLRSRASSLPEIAERLGYADVSGFLHAFKRLKGVSPSQFLAEVETGPSAQSIVRSSHR